MSVESYREAIDRIKKDPEYIKLASRHRGDLDQKNFDRYRLKIAGLEAKMKLLEPKGTTAQKRIAQVGPIRHPINPATARLQREPAPGAKDKEKVIINKSRMTPNREAHALLVKSNEVDVFINGPQQLDLTEPVNNDIFDDIMFDDEPMPDI